MLGQEGVIRGQGRRTTVPKLVAPVHVVFVLNVCARMIVGNKGYASEGLDALQVQLAHQPPPVAAAGSSVRSRRIEP